MADDQSRTTIGLMPAAWDADARSLVEAVTVVLRTALGHDLVSVIVHGSLAMGCYHPPKSDIDMLAVSARALSPDERRNLVLALLRVHDARRSGAGLEISLVTASAAQNLEHPMPYEVHFGGNPDSVAALHAGDFQWTLGGNDPDLSAHVIIARARGVPLVGPPPADVFAPVPWRDYLAAIESDLRWSLDSARAAGNPVYFVLNACRMLQIDALGEGTIQSKEEGAAWALETLPPQYRSIVAAALAHYRSDAPVEDAHLDADAVKTFADFVRQRDDER